MEKYSLCFFSLLQLYFKTVNEAKFLISGINSWNDLMSMKSLMNMKGLGERLTPQRFWIISYTSLMICCHYYSLGHVNEIINVNEGPWRKATPKGSGSLPTPRSGFAATVIPWDIVLCNAKYKWNTDSCDSYLHVIMTLRPAALHSCPYGLIVSFSLS